MARQKHVFPALDKQFDEELGRYAEEKHMPFVSRRERRILRGAFLEGIKTSLKIKFGEAGLVLVPEIESLEDVDQLRGILEAIETARSPGELRAIWTPAEEGASSGPATTRQKGRKRK
jgi:hypothetical protein